MSVLMAIDQQEPQGLNYAEPNTTSGSPPQRSFRLDLFARRNVTQLVYLTWIAGALTAIVVGLGLIVSLTR